MLCPNQAIQVRVAYSSTRGGARNRIRAAREIIPKTGNKYPPKSVTLDATMFEVAATSEKSAMFSIMFIFGASRATKAGPTVDIETNTNRATFMVSVSKVSNKRYGSGKRWFPPLLETNNTKKVAH